MRPVIEGAPVFFGQPVLPTMAQTTPAGRIAQEEFMAACRAALLFFGIFGLLRFLRFFGLQSGGSSIFELRQELRREQGNGMDGREHVLNV